MTKHLIPLFVAIAIAIAVAACGSASSPAATTPAPPAPAGPAHAHDHDATGSGDATGGAVAAPEAPPKEPARAEPSQAATDPKADLLAAETSAWESARPVFDKACATCHTSAGKKATKKKLDHFNVDSYPPGGHHTSTIGFTIRDVLGLSGKKPTMPYDRPGSVQGADLAKTKAWTDAWEAAEKAGAHPASGEHHH
jgi:hypothetical protein